MGLLSVVAILLVGVSSAQAGNTCQITSRIKGSVVYYSVQNAGQAVGQESSVLKDKLEDLRRQSGCEGALPKKCKQGFAVDGMGDSSITIKGVYSDGSQVQFGDWTNDRKVNASVLSLLQSYGACQEVQYEKKPCEVVSRVNGLFGVSFNVMSVSDSGEARLHLHPWPEVADALPQAQSALPEYCQNAFVAKDCEITTFTDGAGEVRYAVESQTSDSAIIENFVNPIARRFLEKNPRHVIQIADRKNLLSQWYGAKFEAVAAKAALVSKGICK